MAAEADGPVLSPMSSNSPQYSRSLQFTLELCTLCTTIEAGDLEQLRKQIQAEEDQCHCCTPQPVYRLITFYRHHLVTARKDNQSLREVWLDQDVFKSRTRSLLLESVAKLLAGGASCNYTTGVETPLMAALTCGDQELIYTLLDFKADINQCDGPEDINALGLAILLNCPSLVGLLLKHGGKVDVACCGSLLPIQLAMNKNHAISNLLIQAGANTQALRCITDQGRGYDTQSPLFVAILRRNVHLANLLLEHGEDVNQTFPENLDCPIHTAVRTMDTQMIDLLAQFGADLNKTNHERHTPLGLALHEDPEANKVAIKLVRLGANPNKKTRISFFQNAYSPLHIACFKGNFEFVRFLMEEVAPHLPCAEEQSKTADIKLRISSSCATKGSMHFDMKKNCKLCRDGVTNPEWREQGIRLPFVQQYSSSCGCVHNRLSAATDGTAAHFTEDCCSDFSIRSQLDEAESTQDAVAVARHLTPTTGSARVLWFHPCRSVTLMPEPEAPPPACSTSSSSNVTQFDYVHFKNSQIDAALDRMQTTILETLTKESVSDDRAADDSRQRSQDTCRSVQEPDPVPQTSEIVAPSPAVVETGRFLDFTPSEVNGEALGVAARSRQARSSERSEPTLMIAEIKTQSMAQGLATISTISVSGSVTDGRVVVRGTPPRKNSGARVSETSHEAVSEGCVPDGGDISAAMSSLASLSVATANCSPVVDDTEEEPIFQVEFGSPGFVFDPQCLLQQHTAQDDDDSAGIREGEAGSAFRSMLCERLKVPAGDTQKRVRHYINQAERDGSTPLFMAVYDGNPDLVEYLLSLGADHFFTCHHGNFLHAAILSQNLRLCRRGLELGCAVNEINVFGNSPLTLVSRLNVPDIVELLIQHGADMNSRDRFGETPLQASIYFGCETNARILIQHGADLNTHDNNHTSALYWAVYSFRVSTIKLLLMAGAHFTPAIYNVYPRNIRAMRDQGLVQFMQHFLQQPRSLQDLTAILVRRTMAAASSRGRSIFTGLDCLPIPERLKCLLRLDHCFHAGTCRTGSDCDGGDGADGNDE